MFDKTFFKFALGFTAIIALGVAALHFSNLGSAQEKPVETASVK